MTESLFSLGHEGKRVLEKRVGCEVRLERQPPKQLDHFVGINDLRIAAESSGDLTYFFACWELPALKWRYSIIPDAVFGVRKQTFAIEFDRGQESLRFFAKTKIETYSRGLAGFPLSAVLIIADREPRMRSLMKSGAGASGARILYSTIDIVRQEGLWAPVFYERDGRQTCFVAPVSSKCSGDGRDKNA